MDDFHNAPPPAASRSTTTRRRKLTVLLITAAAALWFAPSLLVRTPARDWLIDRVTADLPLELQIGSASASWLSAIRLHQVTLLDAGGRPLADADQVVIERPLLGLLRDFHQPGTIQLHRPQFHIQLRRDGSNVEDLLEAWPADDTSSPAAWTVELHIMDGRVVLHDTASQRQWHADDVNAQLSYDQLAGARMIAQLQARIAADTLPGKTGTTSVAHSTDTAPGTATGGRLQLQIESRMTSDNGSPLGQGRLQLSAAGFPLAALQGVLTRLAVDGELDGKLTGKCQYQWQADGARQSLTVTSATVEGAALRGFPWLKGDQLQDERLTASGLLARQDGHWLLRDATLESGLGKFTTRGTAALPSSLGGQSPWSLVQSAVRDHSFQLTARLDLARLAELLPHALRLRSDTTLESGIVDLQLSQTGQPGNRVWQATLHTSDLAAQRDGRRLNWQQPLQLEAVARQAENDLVIDKLLCDSRFLQARASGSLQSGSLSATADLEQLAAELSKLVDLNGYLLAGRLSGEARWNAGAEERYRLQAEAAVEQFELATPESTPWREPRLELTATTTLAATSGRLRAVEDGELRVDAADDHLKLTLQAPVAAPWAQAAWPIACRLSGELARWQPRLRPWLAAADCRVEGLIDLTARGSLAAGDYRAEQLDLQVEHLRLSDQRMRIHEPRLQLHTRGSWRAGEMQLHDVSLTSTTLTLQTPRILASRHNGSWTMEGNGSLRMDLDRFLRWFWKAGQPPSQHLSGRLQGDIQLAQRGGETHGSWKLQVKELALAARSDPLPAARGVVPASRGDQWQTKWYEPHVEIAGAANYRPAEDVLKLANLDISSNWLRVAAAGTVHRVGPARHADSHDSSIAGAKYGPELDITGHLEYDLQQVARRLQPYLGPQVRLEGKQQRAFHVSGPLASARSDDWLKALRANSELGWSRAELYGIAAGPGELKMQLSDAVVTVAPLEVAVSEGTLKLAPRVDLGATPMQLSLPAGSALENVRISPELCQTWLKYVAPLMADATRAEGRFSVQLEGAALPLADPASGRAAGQLQIHAAQVGPGPLAREFLWLAQQIKAVLERRPNATPPGEDIWLQLPAQQIRCQLADGRVHHQGMQLQVKDVVIRTRGSVGLDQSLSLVAEIPLQESWLSRDPLLAGLRGQVLQIPIGGTLAQPQLDKRAIEQLTGQMVRRAATGLFEQQLNRGLKELFGPPPTTQ